MPLQAEKKHAHRVLPARRKKLSGVGLSDASRHSVLVCRCGMTLVPLPYPQFSSRDFSQGRDMQRGQRAYLEVVAWGIDDRKVISFIACAT